MFFWIEDHTTSDADFTIGEGSQAGIPAWAAFVDCSFDDLSSGINQDMDVAVGSAEIENIEFASPVHGGLGSFVLKKLSDGVGHDNAALIDQLGLEIEVGGAAGGKGDEAVVAGLATQAYALLIDGAATGDIEGFAG